MLPTSAADLAILSAEERAAFFAGLTPDEAGSLQYNWSFWARPEQRLPDGAWINWLIIAGRGMGKTRVGAETVRQWDQVLQIRQPDRCHR